MSDDSIKKVLLSKETFCRALQMIQQQDKVDEQFSEALRLVGNVFFLYGVGNRYHDALLMVLKEAMNDQYNYIDWWMYDTDDYRVWTKDGKREWDLKEPGALYDYIANECQDKPEK